MKKVLSIIALLSIVSHAYSDEMGEYQSTGGPMMVGDCRSSKCIPGYECKRTGEIRTNKGTEGQYSCVRINESSASLPLAAKIKVKK